MGETWSIIYQGLPVARGRVRGVRLNHRECSLHLCLYAIIVIVQVGCSLPKIEPAVLCDDRNNRRWREGGREGGGAKITLYNYYETELIL